MAHMPTEALPLLLCVLCQVQLYPHLGLPNPILSQLSNVPMLFPGYLFLLPCLCSSFLSFSLASRSWLSHAVAFPFLVSYGRELRALALCGRRILRSASSVPFPLWGPWVPLTSSFNLRTAELWEVFLLQGDAHAACCCEGELKGPHLGPLFIGSQVDWLQSSASLSLGRNPRQ